VIDDVRAAQLKEAGEVVETYDRALNLLSAMLWNSMVVAAPILIATLVVGVIVSVIQVATQVQEMTLSYVPKLLVAALLLIPLGPWMIERITDFARGLQRFCFAPQLAGAAGQHRNVAADHDFSCSGFIAERRDIFRGGAYEGDADRFADLGKVRILR